MLTTATTRCTRTCTTTTCWCAASSSTATSPTPCSGCETSRCTRGANARTRRRTDSCRSREHSSTRGHPAGWNSGRGCRGSSTTTRSKNTTGSTWRCSSRSVSRRGSRSGPTSGRRGCSKRPRSSAMPWPERHVRELPAHQRRDGVPWYAMGLGHPRQARPGSRTLQPARRTPPVHLRGDLPLPRHRQDGTRTRSHLPPGIQGPGRQPLRRRAGLPAAHPGEPAGCGILVADALRHRNALDGPELDERCRSFRVRRPCCQRGRFHRPVLRARTWDGPETNWIETVPGRGFYPMFRLYSPTAPLFDGTWALPDVEPA